MSRRRLTAWLLVVVALGAAWCCFATGLSAEERALVGTWHCSGNMISIGPCTMTLSADRECQWRFGGQGADPPPCRWSAHAGTMAFDYEPSAFRRLLRPVSGRIGLTVGPVTEFPMEASGDVIVIRSPVSISVYARVSSE